MFVCRVCVWGWVDGEEEVLVGWMCKGCFKVVIVINYDSELSEFN